MNPEGKGGLQCASRRTINPTDLTYGLVVIAAVALFVMYCLALPPNVDIAWYLYVADRVIGGAHLYVDVIEVNPPLIVALMLPAAALARIFPVSAILVFNISVLDAIGLSIALSAHLLRPHASGLSRESWRTMLIVLLAVLLPLANYTFGQRDNLTFILVLPYLCAATARMSGRILPPWAAILAGIMAGLGFALKPFFLPLLLGTEAYVAAKRGPKIWARAESFAILTVFLIYAVAVCVLAPEFFSVARWVVQAYGAYHRVSRLALLTSPTTYLSLIVAGASWRLLAGEEFAELRGVLAIAFVTYLGSFIAQGKGWSYHSYPMVATAAIITAVAILARFGPVTRRLRHRLALWIPTPLRAQALGQALARHRAAVLGLLVLQLGSRMATVTDTGTSVLDLEPWYLSQMRGAIERIAQEGSVTALSVSHHFAFPLTNVAHLRWTSRFCGLWMLPGLYADQVKQNQIVRYHALEELPDLERYLFNAVVEDLHRYQPDVLIVDTTAYAGMPAGFDYLEYFGRDPRFADQFSAYSYVKTIHNYQIFRRDRYRSATSEQFARGTSS